MLMIWQSTCTVLITSFTRYLVVCRMYTEIEMARWTRREVIGTDRVLDSLAEKHHLKTKWLMSVIGTDRVLDSVCGWTI